MQSEHARSENLASAGVAWAVKEDGGWRPCEGDGRKGGEELTARRWGTIAFESWTVLARMTPCERGRGELREDAET